LLTLVLIAPVTTERGLREIQNCVGGTAAGDGFERKHVLVAQRDTDTLCATLGR
jgi:hypothetical protein